MANDDINIFLMRIKVRVEEQYKWWLFDISWYHDYCLIAFEAVPIIYGRNKVLPFILCDANSLISCGRRRPNQSGNRKYYNGDENIERSFRESNKEDATRYNLSRYEARRLFIATVSIIAGWNDRRCLQAKLLPARMRLPYFHSRLVAFLAPTPSRRYDTSELIWLRFAWVGRASKTL